MKLFKFIFLALFSLSVFGQKIPSRKVIEVSELSKYLKVEVQQELSENKKISNSVLANYFRDKMAERYFFDYKNVAKRFTDYNLLYPEQKENHFVRGNDHLDKFPAKTVWKLPFNYQDGEPVNAYALRHLARQHKMIDIAFLYFYEDKNQKYINYFTDQLASLNRALSTNQYDKIEDGNGVYEAFRAGYRVLNWLEIHNLFLGEKSYSDENQLTTIATLLQHGAFLYQDNQEFKSGNHQTRGLSALALVAILLRDFVETDVWYKHAMNLLEEHLRKEINEDGFQFERTIHYHMSDIGNYFYVYQLAKNSNLQVNDFWKNKLQSLFATLTKVAFPDKSAPVLSDDTDTPWAEKNDISSVLTLGYLLFENPEFGYFANTKVSSKMFWFLSNKQLENLQNIDAKKPEVKNYSFPETGYFIQREGWNSSDKMMIISNGLDAKKPDHQHGDMLGIQAMANGNIILPNYQVRYSLKDLELFKNSLTKNVALVDDELQGKKYTSNQGGSGFGKFKQLPNPKTIAFEDNKNFSFYIGSHDGFEDIGVQYSRQVLFVDNSFWIVKDNFSSDKKHDYKQIWQGHYSLEKAPNLLRSTFQNGSGLDIYQLNKVDEIKTEGARGKEWSIVSKKGQKEFNFITVLFPFSKYDERIDEENENPKFNGWKINSSAFKNDAEYSLQKEDQQLFFGVSKLVIGETSLVFSGKVDIYVKLKKNSIEIQSVNTRGFTLASSMENKITNIQPKDIFTLNMNN